MADDTARNNIPENSTLYSDAYDAYDRQTKEAQASYENMAREARINKALIGRAREQADAAAGITYKAAVRTSGQKNDNSLRNALGSVNRQYENYQKNVEHALNNLKIQEAADEKSFAARSESERNANRLTQGRFNAEYGLQKKQLDLYKEESDFNKAYELFLRRMINKNKFKGITGIKVKSLPVRKRKIVKPAVIQDNSPDADKASKDKDYRLVPYTDANGAARHIYVLNGVYNAAKENDVSLTDNNGNPKDTIKLMQDIYSSQTGKNIIKAGTDKVSSITDYKEYAMLPDKDSGNGNEYYFVFKDIINAARDNDIPMYENGKLKSEKQLLSEWVQTPGGSHFQKT